jgi:hypothetical protein
LARGVGQGGEPVVADADDVNFLGGAQP